MVLAVLFFASGVLFLQGLPVFPPAGGWLCSGILLWPFLRSRGRAGRCLIWLACFLFGLGWAAWRAELRLAETLPVNWEGRDIELSGTVASLPQQFGRGSRFELQLHDPSTVAAGFPSRLLLSWYARDDEEGSASGLVHPGESWRLTVRLRRPHGNANPGGFDYEAWLLERGLRATGYVRRGVREASPLSTWSPEIAIERARDALRAGFQARLPEADFPLAGVLLALAIGDQKAIPTELWSIFNRTGVTHLVSISGLHVTMVAGVFGSLLGALWRRIPRLALRLPAQRAVLLAACLMAYFYAGLAGFAVPAQRTAHMLLAVCLSAFLGRSMAPRRVLSLALLLVLLIDPWAVLAAGFWLSFSAVAALLYIGTAVVGTEGGWRAALANWGRVQWAATLISLPLLLSLFGQFSLVSPLANALAVPVVSFLITPLALLGAIVPWPPLLWLAHALMSALMICLEWLASWPLWQSVAPPWWIVGVALIGGALVLLPQGVPGRACGILLFLPALFWPAAHPLPNTVRVTVLDVGQGLSVVLRTASHLLVYDPGPVYGAGADAGQRVLVPYLRTLGAGRVDRLVMTHRDTDHSGGLASLLSAMPVDEVLTSIPGMAGEPCRAGLRWQWDGVDFSVLHPLTVDAHPGEKTNHRSCVLRVEAGGQRLLLTSDIEAEDERALIQRAAGELAAHVLLVPHHGSKTSSTPDFLDAVGAEQAVIPVGYRNRFGHPKPEVLARYQARGMTLWRTDRDGALDILLAPDGTTISAWRQQQPRYWHSR